MKNIMLAVLLGLSFATLAAGPDYYGDPYATGENQGQDYSGTTQNNPDGSIYESQSDKPYGGYGYSQQAPAASACSYSSPCCPKTCSDGSMNWAHPRCPSSGC